MISSALVSGRDVTLYGESDMPDRYGRQPAFVFVDPAAPSLQAQLLAQGAALASGTISDKACAAELAAAEGSARRLKRGIWAQTNVIKTRKVPAISWPMWGVSGWSRGGFCRFARPGR